MGFDADATRGDAYHGAGEPRVADHEVAAARDQEDGLTLSVRDADCHDERPLFGGLDVAARWTTEAQRGPVAKQHDLRHGRQTSACLEPWHRHRSTCRRNGIVLTNGRGPCPNP